MNKDAFEKIMVVAIEEEPIELYKLLKYSNLAQSGGEAKFVISEALVKVNGMVETQKRKKIVENDIVEFNSQKLRVARKIVK